jgi:hypothetical protein
MNAIWYLDNALQVANQLLHQLIAAQLQSMLSTQETNAMSSSHGILNGASGIATVTSIELKLLANGKTHQLTQLLTLIQLTQLSIHVKTSLMLHVEKSQHANGTIQ